MPLTHCRICLTVWSPDKALSMTCSPGSGILHQWITFNPEHSAMSDETAVLAELDFRLKHSQKELKPWVAVAKLATGDNADEKFSK